MVKYNYLDNNKSDFPHIANVDVFKYDNDFDYERFNATQMELQLCSVPWDMGEAHIGARTISGIGNVVYFESKESRNAWFDAIPDSDCYRFETKFKELHRDQVIDVPIPYDMAAKHNYLRVRYSMFANDSSPVQYEGENGLRDWFWFVREVEFVAPNTTRLHLLDDAFQTWIYDINVSSMILERGHAPLFAMSADKYLSNPIANNAYLLTEDVNFGDASQVKHSDEVVLNDGDMYACIATTANPRADWGGKSDNTWHVPASAYYNNQGQPSCYVFAVQASDLNTLLSSIDNAMPQFKQTIQAVFFVSSKLVNVADTFSMLSVTCYNLAATRKRIDLTKLTKSQFGYDRRYSDIAKLYTSPYAHIEISDENGNIDIVRIEDTTGDIDISASLSLAWPFITIDAHLIGVGGSNSESVSFRNVSAHTFAFGGRWYDTLRTWQVPTFAVVLGANREYDYSTHFDRVQRVNDYTTEQANVNASADTGKANADASADLVTDNALLTTTANTAITNISNGSAGHVFNTTSAYNFEVMDIDNYVIASTAASQIAADEAQAAVTAASGAISGVAGAIAAAATGNVAGAVSSAVNGLVGAGSTLASTSIGVNLTSAIAAIQQESNTDHSEAATDKSENDVNTQQATATSMTNAQNTLTSGMAANSSATQKANATRSQTTEKANATRLQTVEKANAARNAANAQNAIDNSVNQAALREPFLFGNFSNGDSAANKPMALFANVVTQSNSAISAAGDEFLRYGYALDRQWQFDGDWNIGKYFTYWKLRDFWVTGLNVPDMYMDKIRFFLFGGVTIWRKPEYIGNVSIYDNFSG